MLKNKMITSALSFLLVFSLAMPVYAQSSDVIDESATPEQEIEKSITYTDALEFLQNENIGLEKLEELEDACESAENISKKEMMLKRDNLEDAYESKEEGTLKSTQNILFKESVISLTKQAQCNNFSEKEIGQYVDGLIESTPDTMKDKMDKSYATKASDHMRPFHDGGAGYEVQSLPGYTESTAKGIVGEGKTNKAVGQAGYMFYTVGGYKNGKYKSNDYGIAYIDGSWKVFVCGKFTGWGTGTPNYNIYTGKKIYIHVSLVGNKIRLRILEGDNFSHVIWDQSYSHGGHFTSNGSNAHFNRQITLCDTDEILGTGLYLRNARFYDSYLYSPSGYAPYSSSNTNDKRRGRFRANWTDFSNVDVHSRSWDEERVSIEF